MSSSATSGAVWSSTEVRQKARQVDGSKSDWIMRSARWTKCCSAADLTTRRERIRSEASSSEHQPSSATGGGYSPRRKYLNGRNTLRFLRSHGTPGRWVAFLCFDLLALPLVIVAAALSGRLRGALAKGLGIMHGLRGKEVNPRYLETGASWLW